MAARLTAYLVVAIVVTTVIAGLIVGAQRDEHEGPVDLIIRNAAVYTADGRGTMAEAVAIRGNQILSVGSNREISRLQRPQTDVIDAGGGAVLPGFNDAGVDLIGGGLRLGALNLAGAPSADAVLERVAAWRAANPSAKWIVGRGLPVDLFTESSRSRNQIDSVVKDRPVLLYGADKTTAWVNTAALRLGNITRKTPDPENGTIGRETAKGEPAGLLQGSALRLVEMLVPPPTREERLDAIRAAVAEASALGITSVQTTEDSPENLELYDAARRAGVLRVRVYAALRLVEPLTETEVDALDRTRTQYPDDPLVKAGALFIPIDGRIDDRTAAMLEPYEDDPEPTKSLFDPDELNRTARLADAAGWQIIAHAGGDRAVRMALTALAHASRSNGARERGRRHRIDDLTLVDEADLPRFGPLGAVASMQPASAAPTPAQMERLARHLGEERAARTYAFRSVAAEARLVFGSAWPANGLDPLHGLHVAVTGTTVDGTPADGWHPNQRLPLAAAIDAYTSTPAWASYDEGRKGTISSGMLADLVVLDRDIFDGPAAALAAASVTATIFDGKVVYSRTPRIETAPVPSLQH